MEIMMRNVAIAAVLVMAIAPAAAAEQSGTTQKSGATQQSGTTQQTPSSAQAGTPSTAAAQAKLRDSLQQAGFKDIKVMDAAYLVHARTSEGNFAVMYIDPPSASGTTGSATPGASAANKAQSMAMTQTKVRDSLEKAGFKEVKIVDAAYLVNANTSDGSKAIMYINPPPAMSADKASTNTPAGNQQQK